VRLTEKLPEEANRKWPIGNRMESNGHITDDIMWSWKVKLLS